MSDTWKIYTIDDQMYQVNVRSIMDLFILDTIENKCDFSVNFLQTHQKVMEFIIMTK